MNQGDIDISEMVSVDWVRLDKLMRLPVMSTHSIEGRNGVVGPNIEFAYYATVDREGLPTKLFDKLSEVVSGLPDTLGDYIDSLGIGFASGSFRILVAAFQTIVPTYQPERRFHLAVTVHLDNGGSLQFVAKAGIAGPSMDAIMTYLNSL